MAKTTKAKATTKATKEGEGRELVAFRLEADLLAQLDAYAKRMGEQMPGLTFNRSDAVRVLLRKALGES